MIVIEDRLLTLEALRSEVKWSENSIEPLGFFSSCDEALPFTLENCPDVIVTDIVIPGISGLDFCSRVNALNKDIKLILISAYSKFEYAKKAIKLNVFDYLEKPLDYSILVQSVQRAGEARKQEQLIQEYVKKNREFYLERFFVKLLSGNLDPNSINLEHELRFLHVENIKSRQICITIQPGDCGNSERREMINYWMFSQITEHFNEKHVHGPFYVGGFRLSLILCDDGLSKDAIHNFFNLLIAKTKEKYGLVVSVGVGSWVSDIRRIRESFICASDSLEYEFLLGVGKIYDSDDLQNNNNWMPYITLEESLFSRVTVGNDKHVRKIILDMREFVKSLDVKAVKALITGTLYKMDGLSDAKENIKLKDLYSVQQYFDCLEDVCLKLCFAIRERYSNDHDRLATEITQYIEGNFSDADLNLTKIAKHVNMSANYVSTIYKKQTGRGISEQLSKVRIKRAKELLIYSEMKISDISRETGYSSPYYFSLAFKKMTGVSPAEYRGRTILLN